MGIKNYVDNKGFWSEQTEKNENVTQISSSVQFLGGIGAPGFADLPLLVWLTDSGPFEGYNTPMIREVTYQNKLFPQKLTWYRDLGKTKKILEQKIDYNSNRTVQKITWDVFESDGQTVRTSASDSIFYISGSVIENFRVRNII